MRSVSSRPCSLRSAVHLVDQVARTALELELGVEREVERDGQAVLARDRPAFLAVPLDEHLVGAELVAVRRGSARRRAPRTRRPRARREPPASSLPSLGPSAGRFGFTRSSLASTGPNSTSLTLSSSAISRGLRPRRRRRPGRRAGAAAGAA